MNVIQALKDYFNEYPELETKTIFVNFLKEQGSSFSIIPSPVQPLTTTNIDGSYEKRFAFQLVGRFAYSNELAMNIKNSNFFQELEEWIIDNNENDILPNLGDGYNSLSLRVTSNGYLMGISPDGRTGQYQINLELTYEKEK